MNKLLQYMKPSKIDKYIYKSLAEQLGKQTPNLIKNILFKTYKLQPQHVVLLVKFLQGDGKAWIFSEELPVSSGATHIPMTFKALCWQNHTPFWIDVSERELQAGQVAIGSNADLIVPRLWHKKLVNSLVVEESLDTSIPLFFASSWGHSKIGELLRSKNKDIKLLNGKDILDDLESDIVKIKNGQTLRTGALLYGPPGTGKSYVARYLALKHKLPIYIVVLTPAYDNRDIIRMFSDFKKPAILLIEDFDSYFDGRVPIDAKAKYTFDSFLNVMDGTYSSLENMIVLMTANNVDKIDIALKNRPSRLKYVRYIGYPDKKVCDEILVEKRWSKAFCGRNLDILLFVKELKQQGKTLKQAKAEIQHMEDCIQHANDVIAERKKAEEEEETTKAEGKEAPE